MLLGEDFELFPEKDKLGQFSDWNFMEFWLLLLFYSDSPIHFFSELKETQLLDHW